MILSNKNPFAERGIAVVKKFFQSRDWRIFVVLTLVVSLVVQDVFFLNIKSARSQTYTVTQYTWIGGIGAKDTPWTTYSSYYLTSATSSPGNIQIATSSVAFTLTQTDDGTSNTGFNMTGVTQETITVSGSGDSAKIELMSGSTDVSNTYTTPGNGNWTVPAGVTSVKIEVWGGGRGGDSNSGGIGGSYARVNAYAVTEGNLHPYTVGGGGSGYEDYCYYTDPCGRVADPANGNNSVVSSTGGTVRVARAIGGGSGLSNTGDVTYTGGAAGVGGGGGSGGSASNGNAGGNPNGGAAVTDGGAGGNALTNGGQPGGGAGAGECSSVHGSDEDWYYGCSGGNGKVKFTYTGVAYASYGTSTSPAINIVNQGWATFSSSTTIQAGTSVKIKVRSGTDSNMTGATAWTSCSVMREGQALTAGGCVTPGHQYIQYQAVLATTDTTKTPSLNSVSIGYIGYQTYGNLISSAFDSGADTNIVGGISWTEDATLPANTSVTSSIRSAATEGGLATAPWIVATTTGAACSKNPTTGLVTCTSAVVPANMRDGSGDRWMQYRVALSSDGVYTPTVGDVTMTYAINAAPRIGNVTAVQNANGTVTISYGVISEDTDTDTNSVGMVSSTFSYCDVNGANCSSFSSQLPLSDREGVVVDDVTYTTNTVTWTPSGAFLNLYRSNATIKVTVDDNQAALNTDSKVSPAFVFDTTDPAGASVTINASVDGDAQLTIAATDDTALEMMVDTDSNFSGAIWVPFATDPTIALTYPSTVYVKFRDAKGNETNAEDVVSASVPVAPSSLMVQDTSNVSPLLDAPEYRLFVAWKALGAGSQYKVERRVGEAGEWVLKSTIESNTTNFYADTDFVPDTTYYYRIAHVDVSGNTSFFSDTVYGIADGVQNAGEGGGGAIALTISAVASSTTPGTATITWDTNQLANSVVGYSTTPGVFTGGTATVPSMVSTEAGGGQHVVHLSGLTAGETYYFRVRSTSASDVTTTDDNGGDGYTLTMKSGPTISKTAVVPLSNTTARVTWETTTAADSVVTYSTNSDLSSSSVTSSSALDTAHSIVITGLSAGTQYYFYVQSTNGSGVTEYDKNIINNSVRYYSFRTTSDSTNPVISDETASVGMTTANITWYTDELATSQVDYGTTNSYGSQTTANAVMTIRHAESISGLTPNTLYYYRVRSTDENGNAAIGSEQTFTTDAEADTTPPTVTAGPTDDPGLTTAVITWTTNEASNSIVDYGTTNAYGAISGSSTESVTSHSVTLTGLTGNTTYKYRIQSSDADGNRVSNDNSGQGHEFTTTLDATAPTISAVTTALVSDTSAVITWTTNEATQAQVKYGTTNAFGTETATTTPYVTDHSVTLSDLTRDTTYYYEVLANDASGNVTTANNNYTFTTTKEPGRNITTGVQPRDTGAPFLSNIQITDITDRGAIVSWSTDEPANALIKYGTSTNYGSYLFNVDDMLAAHSLALTRLIPETTYHLKLYSYDAFGNQGSSSDQTFNTVSTLEALTSVTTTAALGAPAEEAVGPSPEDLRRAFEEAVSGGPVTLIESLLGAMVKNPLISTLSEKLFVSSFTDVANKVIAAPTITGAASKVEIDGDTAKISWVTDKKATSEVGYAPEQEYGQNKLQPYTHVETNPDEFDTKHTVTIYGLRPNTTYHYQLRSKGIAGPTAKSRDEVFKTEAEVPIVTELISKDITEHTATISWKTNIPTSASVEFKAEGSDKTLSQGEADLVRDHSIVLKDLKDGATYTVVIKATDDAGTVATSQPISFITLKDVAPPTFATMKSESTFYAGKESKVQTIISWETDEPSTSQVFYKEGVTDKNPTIAVPEDSTLVKKHTVVITKFKPGAVYKFWVISKDIAGNEGRSKDFTVLTPQQRETVVDIIINNFEQVFGWTQRVGM